MTTPNHRQQYYARYVSAAPEAAREQAWSYAQYAAWCDEHLLPWLAGEPRDARILEIGCGDGTLLAYLRDNGFTEVRGVDVSDEQVALARRRSLDVRAGDAMSALAEHDHELGGVIAVDVLEHFTKSEVDQLLARVAHALAPGGFLLVRTPNGEGLFAGHVIHGDLTHCTTFTPRSLAQALRLAGFGSIAFREALFVRGSVRGRARMLAWVIIRGVANAIRVVQTGRMQAIWSENLLCLARTPRRTSS